MFVKHEICPLGAGLVSAPSGLPTGDLEGMRLSLVASRVQEGEAHETAEEVNEIDAGDDLLCLGQVCGG